MATSIISNTVTDLSGVVVGGVTVTAKLVPGSAFRTATFLEVASMVTTTSDVNGNWSLVLERNSDVVPSGTYYVVTEKIPDAKGGTKSYTIQVGAVNASLLASLVFPIAAPTLVTDSFLTQQSADARYQALGALSGGVPALVNTDDPTGSAGVSTSGSRSDHDHGLASVVWSNWTPVVTQGVNVTYTINRATYQKTGRLVTFWAEIVTTSAGTNGAIVLISGLPFVSAAPAQFSLVGVGSIFDSSAADDLTGILTFNGSTTLMRMLSTRATGSLGNVSLAGGLAAGDTIRVAGSFEVTV